MRQVINKLITEEDLYGAVESAFSQGWRRVKLYFLTGLPTETDEDTLGIADAGPRVRGHRPARTSGRVRSAPAWAGSCPSRRRRSSGSAQDTVGRAARARSGCCGTHLRGDKGVQLRWHDPRATLAEGIASRGDRRIGAVIEDVWRAGGHLPGVVASTSTSDAGTDGHGPPRPVDRLVRAPPAGPRRGPALGARLGRPARGLPLAGLAGRPGGRGRARGLPLDALLRLRRLHRLRPRARRGVRRPSGRRAARAPARISPVRRRPSRSSLGRSRRRWRRCHEGPDPLHQAGQDPLDQPSGRGPHVGAGVSPDGAAGGLHRRASRPGPRSASGWPFPPATSPWPSTSTSSWRRAELDVGALPARLSAGPPAGRRRHRLRRHRRSGRLAAGSRSAPARGRLGSRRRPRRDERRRSSSSGRWPPTTSSSPDSARGRRSPTTSAPPSSPLASSDPRRVSTRARPHAVGASGVRAGHPPAQPAAVRVARRPRPAVSSEGHVRRLHQWIVRDGARWEPLPARRDGRAARRGACVMRRESSRCPSPSIGRPRPSEPATAGCARSPPASRRPTAATVAARHRRRPPSRRPTRARMAAARAGRRRADDPTGDDGRRPITTTATAGRSRRAGRRPAGAATRADVDRGTAAGAGSAAGAALGGGREPQPAPPARRRWRRRGGSTAGRHRGRSAAEAMGALRRRPAGPDSAGPTGPGGRPARTGGRSGAARRRTGAAAPLVPSTRRRARPKIGDTRPAPGAAGQPAATRRRPAAARRGRGPAASRGEPRRRRAAGPARRRAADRRRYRQRRRRAGAGRGRGRRAAGAGPSAGRDAHRRADEARPSLDPETLERRRGRERKGRPVGRYLMGVHSRPQATQIAVLEGRR